MGTEKSGRCCSGAADSTVEKAAPDVKRVTGEITFANKWDHFIARWGYDRFGHRVEPGLYSIGAPNPESPVFVTANYTLSFDALRSSIEGMDAYILVLETRGINVWCAAGKGTFGTDELVGWIEAVNLKDVVSHRRLILPQLGAPGVAAHVVKKRSGFKVEYGPVLASDVPEYMKTGKATAEMRKVKFPARDRFVLIPVELAHAAPIVLVVSVLMFIAGGWLAFSGVVAAAFAGLVLFPLLLPSLPFYDFSVKGFILGFLAAIPFAIAAYFGGADIWSRSGWAAFYLLFIPSVTAYLSLNFTGSTTFTSQTGVKKEIYAMLQRCSGCL